MDDATTEMVSGVSRRRRRRRMKALGWVAAAALVLAAAVVASIGFTRPGEPSAAASTGTGATVDVKRETLVNYVTADGSVGYGTPQPLSIKASGTVTWLPAIGSTIQRGKTLLRVDDQPVVLFYGALPMYRELTTGMKGHDVQQFETNLRALGYTGFTVDEEFSDSTTAAVKRWQHDLALPETGIVTPGQVVYQAGAVRVAQALVRVGGSVPADVLQVTGTTRVVTASIPAGDAVWAVSGALVEVVLPSGGTLAGKITSVGNTAAGSGSGDVAGSGGSDAGSRDGGSANVQLNIGVADQAALGKIDGGTLTVRHAFQQRRNVLTVPVEALLALAEGGYGIEVVDGAGSRIVAVDVGMFAGGRVEVTSSELQPGTHVRVPE